MSIESTVPIATPHPSELKSLALVTVLRRHVVTRLLAVTDVLSVSTPRRWNQYIPRRNIPASRTWAVAPLIRYRELPQINDVELRLLQYTALARC